ncbi:MAG: pantetheine-phosphate adenylyltransferase [bacterium]
MRRAVYPGTFDPITRGHLDLIKRALKLFDEVVVAISADSPKTPTFSIDERKDMIEYCLRGVANVQVVSFHGLLVNFIREVKAQAIIRGLRAVSDFEFELQMALVNRKLLDQGETVFLTPKDEYIYLSSSIVKELAHLGGCVDDMVDPYVRDKLHQKFSKPTGVHEKGNVRG